MKVTQNGQPQMWHQYQVVITKIDEYEHDVKAMEALTRVVAIQMKKGWQPIGGVAVTDNRFYQAMAHLYEG